LWIDRIERRLDQNSVTKTNMLMIWSSLIMRTLNLIMCRLILDFSASTNSLGEKRQIKIISVKTTLHQFMKMTLIFQTFSLDQNRHISKKKKKTTFAPSNFYKTMMMSSMICWVLTKRLKDAWPLLKVFR